MACASCTDWRERARKCVLSGRPFLADDGLVWLAVTECAAEADLMPLASLAECGHSDCACTRSLYPWVRQRFREEVVQRATDAQAAGSLPANGRINYVSVGSGLLLGDLDVIMGLQDTGFKIEHATFIDSDYRENCHGALAEVAQYLAPARVVAYSSVAAFVAARLSGKHCVAAHMFLQIDVMEVDLDEAAVVSALALGDEGGGMGFRLANRHHPTLVPMISWRRMPTPGSGQQGMPASLTTALRERVVPTAAAAAAAEHGGAGRSAAVDPIATYSSVRKLLNAQSLVKFDTSPVARVRAVRVPGAR